MGIRYSIRYETSYEHEYIKNNTALKFDSVQESKTYNPSTGTYTFNYYYLNFLEDSLSLKVAPYQRNFVADNAISFAEAYAAERHGTKTECFVAYKENHPVGFASIAFGAIGVEGEKKWMRNSYCLWRFIIERDHSKFVLLIYQYCRLKYSRG